MSDEDKGLKYDEEKEYYDYEKEQDRIRDFADDQLTKLGLINHPKMDIGNEGLVRISELEQEVTRLRDKLLDARVIIAKHARHHQGCVYWKWYYEERGYKKRQCSCGFDKEMEKLDL